MAFLVYSRVLNRRGGRVLIFQFLYASNETAEEEIADDLEEGDIQIYLKNFLSKGQHY